jgi:hypothetical protein
LSWSFSSLRRTRTRMQFSQLRLGNGATEKNKKTIYCNFSVFTRISYFENLVQSAYLKRKCFLGKNLIYYFDSFSWVVVRWANRGEEKSLSQIVDLKQTKRKAETFDWISSFYLISDLFLCDSFTSVLVLRAKKMLKKCSNLICEMKTTIKS